MIKWNKEINGVCRTTHGTTEGRLYYWVRRDGVDQFRCGYFAFGREVERQNKVFATLDEAKAYCVDYDANIVDTFIVEVSANA